MLQVAVAVVTKYRFLIPYVLLLEVHLYSVDPICALYMFAVYLTENLAL